MPNLKECADSKKAESESEKQSIDISAPGVATALSKRIANDIDEYCAKAYDDGPRKHLGASLIGHDCSRYLWYVFRWCLHERHSGRQQRLFNRGHKEEARFIEWLEGIGAQVWAEDYESNPLFFDPIDNKYYLRSQLPIDELTEQQCVYCGNDELHIERAKADGLQFPQYRISGVNGHFGGSLDGIARLPERYRINEPVLLEFKTNGTGNGFNKLCDNGMAVAKPQHFAQTSTYGYKYGFNYVLYLNINKNDDSMHVEVVKLNHNLGAQMEAKAERIIMSQTAPARLSDNPTFQACGWCAMKGICHNGEVPERNCRSCKFATPVENGEWFCSIHNANIPVEFIPKGCPSWNPITNPVE